MKSKKSNELVDPLLLAQLPKSAELITTLLNVLEQLGGSGTNKQIEEATVKQLGLSEEAASIPHDHRSKIGYRLAWAQTYLKSIGALENPEPRMWKIPSLQKQEERLLEWFLSRYKKLNKEEGIRASYSAQGELIKPQVVIENEFNDKFNHQAILNVLQRLSQTSEFWISTPEYIQYFNPQPTYWAAFKKTLNEITEMADLKLPRNKNQAFKRMLYARIYGAIEAYLCDAITYSILENDEDDIAIEEFVTNVPSFSERNLKMKEVFDVHRNIRTLVNKHLSDFVWHRFRQAENIYKAVYNISFPTTPLNALEEGLKIRHDIIHRDGKNYEGKTIKAISKSDIITLATIALKLAENINEQLEAATTY